MGDHNRLASVAELKQDEYSTRESGGILYFRQNFDIMGATMSSERKLVHITLLEPKEGADFRPPELRHLSVGKPMDFENAYEVAKGFAELFPNTQGHIFVEGEDASSTKQMDCTYCNQRKTRYDFYWPVLGEIQK